MMIKRDLPGLVFVLASFFVFIAMGCADGSSKKTNKEAYDIADKKERPKFDSDSAYVYIERQVAFGPRVPGTDAHAACLDYMVDFFNEHGASVTVQEGETVLYDGRKMPLYNVIASYNLNVKRRVMLCAHWDSRPYADSDPNPENWHKPILGANDGASGVGVLMEIGRQLEKSLPDIGVDIILFDIEDWGEPEFYEGTHKEDTWCLGSQYWAKNLHVEGYNPMYGILLDMVAAPGARFFKEGVSMHFAKGVVDKVWSCAADLGYGYVFLDNQAGMMTDDHLYVNTIAGIKCIDIIQYNPLSLKGFGDYWHTLEDDMRNIDRATLNAVGETLLEVLYRE